jgi:hypothetical protein
VDRRIIFAPIINCQALTANGTMDGGQNPNVPVAAIGKFFLIHPITGPLDQIDAEFVGLATVDDPPGPPPPNTVQLYR